MPSSERLSHLIKNLSPTLNEGDFVFVSTKEASARDIGEAIGTFREKEGLTLILRAKSADELGLKYESHFAWITLNVASSLTDVGLTAVVADVLATKNISCNVVAGYHHDHLFVPKESRSQAMELLHNLGEERYEETAG